MTIVAEHNLVPLLIALLIGLVVGFWLFRAVRAARDRPPVERIPPAPAPRPRHDPVPDGHGVQDDYAAATKDIAGEFLGVEAHPIVAGPAGPPDNLQTLKGVGPKLAAQLNGAGVTRFDQLARLTPNEVAYLDERMGAFNGRIARDRLVEQSAYLARGDTDGFEAVFGKLGGGA
jgi:predicted flap endonuclease-1-like 5' DNA nuclease